METNKAVIRESIEKVLKGRIEVFHLKGKKAKEEEAIFLSGAAAALQAVFGNKDALTDYVPPMWVICPMSGRSIFDCGAKPL